MVKKNVGEMVASKTEIYTRGGGNLGIRWFVQVHSSLVKSAFKFPQSMFLFAKNLLICRHRNKAKWARLFKCKPGMGTVHFQKHGLLRER